MKYLTFALAKGRLAKKSLALFEQIGISMDEMKDPDTRKLIFVNEDLKKQKINTKKDLSAYAEPLKTHELPKLLFLIKDYLEDDVYEFLLNLSSFIYYNEGKDDSFSRYLVDKELEFDKLKPVRLYYVDLKNYIIEFYKVMEGVFRNINFGFDIEGIFT